MSDPMADIQAQLDSLLKEAGVTGGGAPADAAPVTPDEPAASATSQTPIDAGAAPATGSVQSEDELADQIDQLLKEANQQVAASTAGAARSTHEPMTTTTADASQDTMAQIDAMLADHAGADLAHSDDLLGDIQTVEEATRTTPSAASAQSPPPEAAAAPASPVPADAPDADANASLEQSLDEMLEGDIQTVEEAAGGTSKPPVSSAAAAVAAELDLDAGLSFAPEPAETPSAPAAPPSAAEPDVAPASATAPAPVEPPPPAAAQAPAPPRPGLLIAALQILNRPLMGLNEHTRNLVGFIGLETLLVGAGLLAFALAGMAAALLVAALALPALLAAFYIIFCKRPNGGSAPTPSA